MVPSQPVIYGGNGIVRHCSASVTNGRQHNFHWIWDSLDGSGPFTTLATVLYWVVTDIPTNFSSGTRGIAEHFDQPHGCSTVENQQF
jgi:hypothetical protein